MDELTYRCVCCMHEKPDFGTCPTCGAECDPPQAPACLPMRSLLAERYFIGVPLHRNGESITYLAYDNDFDCACFVREFYPTTIARRSFDSENVLPMTGCDTIFNECRSEYLTLWEKIRRLRGLPGLVSITDIMERNSTVYAVTPNVDEVSLREYLTQQPSGFITWEQARILFVPLITTLSTLHAAGILHCGLSPDTMTVDREGKVRLMDFAIRRLRTAKNELDPELFDGYCAIEQYESAHKIGTWTDVYAFAAVLYRSLTGAVPIAAPFRVIQDTMTIPARIAKLLPGYAIDAIIDAMQIYPMERTQTMDDFRQMITAPASYLPPKKKQTPPEEEEATGTEEEEAPAEETEQADAVQPPELPAAEEEAPAKEEPPELKKKRTALDNAITIMLVVILLLTLTGIGFVAKYLHSYMTGETDNPNQPTATVASLLSVPNCLGQTQEWVNSQQEINNYFTISYQMDTTASQPKGTIAKQVPEAGAEVAPGTTLYLYVSALAMPDLTDKQANNAKELLTSAGLSFSVEYKSYSEGDASKSGTVAYTTPTAGSAVIPGELKMYNAKDGQYYDVLLYVWEYRTFSGEAITQGDTPEGTSAGVADSNVYIDIDIGIDGNNSVG